MIQSDTLLTCKLINDRITPITCVLLSKHYDITKKLLVMGVDPNVMCKYYGSPLTIAIGQNNDIFELLLEYRADIKLAIEHDRPLTQFIECESGVKLLIRYDGLRILEKAVKSFRTSRILLCVKYVADVNRKGSDGNTLLHKILRYAKLPINNVSHEDLEQTWKLLLEHGVDPMIANDDGKTVFNLIPDNLSYLHQLMNNPLKSASKTD